MLLGAFVLSLPAAGAAAASSAGSVASREQIAWVRRAALRFLHAELGANGAEACSVLNAPLRATVDGRTCEGRWDARLHRQLREPGVRARLRAQERAVPSAPVAVRGYVASIELPAPLLRGPNHFLWTENCWMLAG